MENWIDSIIIFLLVSSALLLALGGVSFLFVQIFKIRGKASLLICSILIIMPLVYPIGTLIPNHTKIPIPLEGLPPLYSQAIELGHDTISEDIVPLIGADKTSFNQHVFNNTQTSDPQIFDTTSMPWSKRTSLYAINWKLIIAIAWITLFLLILFRLLFIVKRTKLLLKCADRVTDHYTLALLKKCAAETGVRRIPRLLAVDRVLIPMAVGFLHPAIVIPKKLLEPAFYEGLRFTLLHELKHLQRHHNWWLLIEALISAAYFFHPVIYWAKQRIHEEWEYICDRHVIQVTNRSASYADFLLNEIWNHGCGMNPSVAVPFILNARKTTKRLYSILEKKRPTLFIKIRDRFAVSIIFVCFISFFLCSVTPSAHIKEDDLKNNNIETFDNPGESYVPAVKNPLENSMEDLIRNRSITEQKPLQEQKSEEATDVIQNPIPSDPETASVTHVSGSIEAANEYDLNLILKDDDKDSADTVKFAISEIDTPNDAKISAVSQIKYAGIDEIGSQLIDSEIAMEKNETDSRPSMDVAFWDVDKEMDQIRLENDYSIGNKIGTTLSKGDDNAKKPVSSKAEYIPEKYNLDSQLERVSKIWKSDPVSWESVDYQSFILQYGSSYYLIVLNTPDYRLPFRETLQIGSWNEMIRPGYDNVNGYVIYRIYRFKDYEQVKAIRIQLSEDKNKTDVVANTEALGRSIDSVSIPKGARIYGWKVIDDRNIVIRTQFYGDFKATLEESCPEISSKKIIGSDAQWPYELDEQSSIFLSNGDKYKIQKLVPYSNNKPRGIWSLF